MYDLELIHGIAEIIENHGDYIVIQFIRSGLRVKLTNNSRNINI